MSDSVRPHRWQSTRLLHPWDYPGKKLEWLAISFSNACMHAKSLQSCLTLCDPMDSSPPGSSVHRILQARILEWVAISFSRGSSQPRDQTWSPALQVDSLLFEPPGSQALITVSKGLVALASLFTGTTRRSGEGNGNPLQHSCLENPVDRGAWWAAVHRVAQRRT